jgi:hypothetical protein
MKRYYNNNNLNIDPVRSFTPNNMIEFNQPINKLKDDIMINQLSLKKSSPSSSFDISSMNKPLNQLGSRVNKPMNQLGSRVNKPIEQFSNIQQNINPSRRNYQMNGVNNSLKSKEYHQMDEPVIDFLPKNNSSTIVPLSNNHINVAGYNTEKYKFNSMTQELFDKDEEIQKYKNEVYHLQIELNHVKKEKSKMISADTENQLLKDKLNEHYEISRELTSVQHNLKRIQLEKKGNTDTIETLKSIIHKQHIQLYKEKMNQTKQIEYSDSESDEGIISDSESDEDSYTDSSSESDEEPIVKKPIVKKPIAKKPIAKKPIAKKPIAKKPIAKKPIAKKPIAKKPVPKKDNIQEIVGETGIKATSPPLFTISKNTPMKKYYNQNLRNAMVKHNLNPEKIDKTMEKMKVTPQTKITKELINEFLNQIK